jgi:formylglycine-generating enzyme required for sulfatase activity
MSEQEKLERRCAASGERRWCWAAVLGACAAVVGIVGACSSEPQGDSSTAKATPSSAAPGTRHPEPSSSSPDAWPFDAAEAKRRQDEAARKLAVSVNRIADLGNGVTLPLVLIPPGEFDMGSPAGEDGRSDNERLHRVTIAEPFWIGQCEVTQEQWRAVMGDNPSNFKGDKNPVENVSWDMCKDFVGRLNARGGKGRFALPTEAQWEWACRAGSSARFSFGDRDGDLGEYAWYSSNSANATHPVGQKKPNAWGLYDLYGNVWEWLASPYSDRYDGSETRGADAGVGDRVLRGGSWGYLPWTLRSADRNWNVPSYRYDRVGFRVVWRSQE